MANRFIHSHRTERTRARWAKARNLLMQLVAEGKLDVRSQTFRRLYHLQTFVLRRPDEYKEISSELFESFADRPGDSSGVDWIRDESADWPDEMVNVFREMVGGIGGLILLHLGWRRLAPLMARMAIWATAHASGQLLLSMSEKLEATARLTEAERQVDQLARAS